MTADRDDELARTATAPKSSSAVTPAQEVPIGSTLGRYRLERELGAGGMGVVHAAFDPDLERRVALKVLRTADSSDARQRLLREARAMAKLSHPNVVVVHEVGSANGRDYVAMELIEGDTLAEWSRATQRSELDILTAFSAAGRGLAAAHSAGIVHRDFKPHNVLRSRDGRILVTDFGLASGVEAPADKVALEETLRAEATSSALGSSPLVLTATGAVLGTPAYMAPEAWKGQQVGPRADQFGFCVALWEALAGERPFRGDTIEELRGRIDRGVSALDMSKIPRRLRPALMRGLSPDPAKRFPSMDALLAEIQPKRRRHWTTIAIPGSALAMAGVLIATQHGERAPTCPPPAIAWPEQPTGQLVGAGHDELAKAIDRDLVTWRQLRTEACTKPDEREPTLTCLDGVLARTDAIRQAAATLPGALASDELVAGLIDPMVCTRSPLPRLRLAPNADVVTALAMFVDAARSTTKVTVADATAFADKPDLDPCARTFALSAAMESLKAEDTIPQQRALSSRALAAAEICADDRVIADVVVTDADYRFEVPVSGAAAQDALHKAEAAVNRVEQSDLVASVDLLRGRIAADHGRVDEALDRSKRAVDAYGKRGDTFHQLRAVRRELTAYLIRGNTADYAAVRTTVDHWKPLAVAVHDHHAIDVFDRIDATARFGLGDVAAAQDIIIRLWRPATTTRPDSAIAVEGIVVDRSGKPMAGATVATNDMLTVTSLGIVFPQFGFAEALLRTATTDAAGKFTIPDASTGGVIMAEAGDQRSLPIPNTAHVRIVVEPTRRVSGKVILGSLSSTKARVIVIPVEVRVGTAQYIAPINPDGTFTLERIPVEDAEIGVTQMDDANEVTEYRSLAASTKPTTDLVLTPPQGKRDVDVIARSDLAVPLDNAQVFMFVGRVPIKTARDLFERGRYNVIQAQFAQRVVGEAASKAALGKLRKGDLLAHFGRVRDGELTICAVALPSDITDYAAIVLLRNHRTQLSLKCEYVGPNDSIVVIDTPPQKRFD